VVCVDVAGGVVLELEAALLERLDDVCLVALRHEDVVGEVGGDEEDGTMVCGGEGGALG